MPSYQASDYASRAELEIAVSNDLGLTTEPKLDSEIVGTADELKRLFLSQKSVFWGIKVNVTDKGSPPEVLEKPQRGVVHEFGLDSQLKQPPQ